LSNHLLHRLLRVEELVRRRRADEHRRQFAAQRAARIDPNPHQISAVIFALRKIPDGGCILADEVGLGKTIEAGLVIAQLRAEGARRVLIVTPKSLLGQWKQELYTLFGIDAREVTRTDSGLEGEGVFLVTRDTAGSQRGSEHLVDAERFDLCVIDEAHEVFAGIHRRFDAGGAERGDSDQAKIAARLSNALRTHGTPVVLLTATPIQNSLLELWGLIHYVDPTGTLLGDLATFRQLFCPTDARVITEGLEDELQGRLATIMNRTLRRQAQEFIREPFVRRQARLFEYHMSPDERGLYEDVTSYLLEPDLCAFPGKQRQLLLIGFHRRMASSLRALSASLENVADRLRRQRDGKAANAAADAERMLSDLEDDDVVVDTSEEAPTSQTSAEKLQAELERVEGFIQRANALPADSKAQALVRAVKTALSQGGAEGGSGKLVIFTESRKTQEYLRELLVQSRVVTDEQVTLFNGTNDSPRAAQALRRWRAETGDKLANAPSDDVAMRLALIEEFRTRSSVFIATEAGAKGLNLQFCEVVVNYDLPWNPQRIEQRIGRCHRYGQKRDVVVVNFMAADNEAQRLTYEILSQKLELFGAVLGATDEVLHDAGTRAPESLVSALGHDFETQLRRIYDRARSLDDVAHDLRALRDDIESKKQAFEDAQRNTEALIRSHLDGTVQQTLRRISEDMPRELELLDADLERVVATYLDAIGATYRIDEHGGVRHLVVPQQPPLVTEEVRCVLGVTTSATEPSLHVTHPLVLQAVDATRSAALARRHTLKLSGTSLTAQRGRLQLYRLTHHGFELVEQLFPVVVLEGQDGPLDLRAARDLLGANVADAEAIGTTVSDDDVQDAIDELQFTELGEFGQEEHIRFERTIEQIERSLADRLLLLNRSRDGAVARLARAETQRDNANGPEPRNRAQKAMERAQQDIEDCEASIAKLQSGDDPNYQRWREHTQARRYARPTLDLILDAEIEIQ
jgi:superfamily II DNA or RNA helicase